MFERMSERARRILVQAREEARALGHAHIGTEHLLLAVRGGEGSAVAVLSEFGVDWPAIAEQVLKVMPRGERGSDGHIPFSPRALRAVELSLREAEALGSEMIEPEHILLALVEEGEGLAARVLVELQAEPSVLRARLIHLQHQSSGSIGNVRERVSRDLRYRSTADASPQLSGGYQDYPSSGGTRSSGSAVRLAGPGASHGVLVRDLTYEARENKLLPVVGFDDESARMLRILQRRSGANVLLVGPPGVGKTALVEGLAQRAVRPDRGLGVGPIYRITLSAAMARSDQAGNGNAWLDDALRECASRGVIVFFDDLHRVVPAGRRQSSVVDLLHAMAESDAKVIAAVTDDCFERHLAADSHLLRRFQVIRPAEPSPDQTLAILKAHKPGLEAHHRVQITDEAVEAAAQATVEVAGAGGPGAALPGRAVDLLDEAAAWASCQPVPSSTKAERLKAAIDKVRASKEAAIGDSDFEAAARYRDEEQRLLLQRNEAASKRKPPQVDQAVIATIAAEWGDA